MFPNIQGLGMMQGMQPNFTPQPLTDEQKTQVQSILSQYDPDNLTAEDAKSIFKSFREAGIRPGAGLKETIEAAGFDANELRSMAMPEGHRPPPMSAGGSAGSQGIDISALETLKNVLSQFDLSNLSSDDENNLFTQLSQAGLMNPGSMINLSA